MIYYPTDRGDADARRVFNLLGRFVPGTVDGFYAGNVYPCRDDAGYECVQLWLTKGYDGKYERHQASGKLPKQWVPVAFYKRQARKLARRINAQVRLHRRQMETWRDMGIKV